MTYLRDNGAQMDAKTRLELETKLKPYADEEAALEFGLDWLELVFFGRQERLRRKRHDV